MKIKWTLNKKKINDDELIINDIVDKCLNRVDVERLISPLADEYFLIDKVNEICVLISTEKITISNHNYSIQKQMGLSFNEKLKKIVRNKIDEERQELKRILFKNETDLLLKIKDII